MWATSWGPTWPPWSEGQGIYNIGTGVATDTLELWLAVQKAAGRETWPITGARSRAGDIRYSALDCAKAADGLGWRPQSDLLDGLAGKPGPGEPANR